MKNTIYTKISIVFLAIGSSFSINAQEYNAEDIKLKIKEVSEKEINAFKTGDCKTLSSFIDDNATFYLNGKKAPSKKMIIGFCNSIERPFEQAAKVEMEYLPISKNSGYAVRTMEFSKEGKAYKREIVTKIWVKGENGWKIVHLHSTITDL